MTKKTKQRSPSKASRKADKPALLKAVVSRFLRLFQEELPVTEFHGNGKFETEVDTVALHQDALEAICGGRTFKKQKFPAVALLTPDKAGVAMSVSIEGRPVGELKKADAKFLLKQLEKAGLEPCAVKVSAQIRDGRQKKNGTVENFTVVLCLPEKPVKKPKAPTVQESADDEA